MLNDAYRAYLERKNKELGITDFTLVFETGEGSKIDSISKPKGTLISLFEYTPTHDIYIFDGWYDSADYTNELYNIQLEKDTTVYAKWDKSKIIVIEEHPPFFEDASDWAIPELETAFSANLIPSTLLGLDMKKSISREEFAELAVRLFETATGKTILITGVNPFTDTANPQILKAYQVGITAGTSETTFSPDTFITREQCATMLYRTIKAMVPGADFSIAGIQDFVDQEHIASWATEGTKYMFKVGIILGNTQGEFMPKPLNAAHEAAGYGMASREAAILMAIRTYNTFNN